MKYNKPEVVVLEPAMTAVESLVKSIPLVFEIGSPPNIRASAGGV